MERGSDSAGNIWGGGVPSSRPSFPNLHNPSPRHSLYCRVFVAQAVKESVPRTGVRGCDIEQRRDIRRGVLIQAFPAPSNMLTLPSGEVVEVSSEANVPGHIVFTRILSLSTLAVV
jgi:hypothetical protein